MIRGRLVLIGYATLAVLIASGIGMGLLELMSDLPVALKITVAWLVTVAVVLPLPYLVKLCLRLEGTHYKSSDATEADKCNNKEHIATQQEKPPPECLDG